MKETGHVVSVSDDMAVVAMRMSGACKKCGLCKPTGDGKEVLLSAENGAGARAGDIVEIEIMPGRVLVAAFAVYMIPVVMTILGYLVGNRIAGGAEDSFLPIGLSLAFLVVSFVAVWLYDLRIRRSERRDAFVRRVLSEEEVPEHIRVVKFGG